MGCGQSQAEGALQEWKSVGVCVGGGGGGGGGGLDSIYLYGLKVKGKHERSMLKVPPNLDWDHPMSSTHKPW